MRQKIKGAVEDIFQQDQLKDIDKRLIRGVYQRKIKDDMKKERALNNIQKLFGKHLKSAKAIEEQPDEENKKFKSFEVVGQKRVKKTASSPFISQTDFSRAKTKNTDQENMKGHISMFLDSESQFDQLGTGTVKNNEDMVSNSLYGAQQALSNYSGMRVNDPKRTNTQQIGNKFDYMSEQELKEMEDNINPVTTNANNKSYEDILETNRPLNKEIKAITEKAPQIIETKVKDLVRKKPRSSLKKF